MDTKLDKRNVQDIFELSMVQKGMLFHYLNEDNNIYNAQLSLKIEGILEVDILRKAFNILQSNNEVLRSVFKWEGLSKPLQIVLRESPVNFMYHDISSKSENEILQLVSEYAQDDFNKRFSLSEVPFRISIIKTDTTSFILFITHHHILYDGWSTGILLKELFGYYQYLLESGPNPGLLIKPGYKEYINGLMKKENAESKESYWKNYLDDFEMQSASVNNHNNDSENIVTKITSLLNAKSLEAFSIKYQVTKAAIVYTALAILLQKLKGESDVVIGTTVSDRDSSITGSENIIGNFINTVPLRVISEEAESFLDIVRKIHSDIINRGEYKTSYYEVKKIMGLKASEELFDTLVVVENYPIDEEAINSHHAFSVKLNSVQENTGIPMVVTVFFKEQLEIEVIYQNHMVDKNYAETFLDHIPVFLETLIENPDHSSDCLSFLSETEQEEILIDFNNTATHFKTEETILSRFEKIVINHPEKIAVICGNESVSYKVLDEESNKVAAYLQQKKRVKKGDLVGLLLNRDRNLISVILGVLKAGACYVPIDPAYPSDRIHYIIESSNLSVTITHNKSETIQNAILIEEIFNENEILPLSSSKAEQNDLAYIIFTSGSTGNPKGVMISHAALMNYISWASEKYVGNDTTVFPLYSSISFDLTITSIFTPLVTGNTIVVYEDDDSVTLIEKVLKDNQADIIKLTPSHLRIINDNGLLEKYKSKLKKMIIGGEDLDYNLAQGIWNKLNGQLTIYNEYGPTEATVGCMIYTFDPSCKFHSVPLGKPISNTQIYILDQYLNPVPYGVKGEIYIAGDSLANGYLGREDLTAERFCSNPFLQGKKMYKTGDYAVRQKDGNIIFSGRIDEQVKISGYRIELKEIEHQLNSHIDITGSLVTVKQKNGSKFLAGYYIADNEIDSLSLRDYLSGKLPQYMVPSYYVKIDAFPLSANGKLNLKALPDPEIKINEQYEEPSTKEESLLAEHFANVLGLSKVGITDNYFSIGGDSIKSIQISSRMRNAGYQVSVQEIFKNPTIKQLALKIKPLVTYTDQMVIEGKIEPTPIQKWFFKNSNVDRHHFNQSAMLHFNSGISSESAKRIFAKIIEHHDALRIVFTNQEGEITSYNKGLVFPVSLEEHDINEYDIDLLSELSNRIQSTISLENGPLIKLGLFHSNGSSRLLIVIHHLVVDGISWRILLEDVKSLYDQDILGKSLALPLKTDSFKDWSEKLTDYSKAKSFESSISYWDSIFAHNTVVPLKRDHENEENRFSDQQEKSFILNKNYTGKLQGEVHERFGTQINDILLTSLMLSFQEFFGVDGIALDLEGHGREEFIKNVDINRTVGWFTSIYPVFLNDKGNLRDTIRHIKETLRNIPNNGADYLLYKYNSKNNSSDKANNIPLSFNYLGEFETENQSFLIVNEGKGEDVSPKMIQHYDWNVIGMVTDGCLQISLRYSNKQYEASTIDRFIEVYHQNLQNLIDYCIEYPVNEMTPSDLIFKEISQAKLDEFQKNYQMEDIYPLSSMQEGMLFHSVLGSDHSAYLEQKVLSLQGNVKPDAVEKSMNELLKRYDLFRAVFHYQGLERPVQIILNDRLVKFTFKDIRKECSEGTETEVVEWYRSQDASEPFDLQKDVLMRIMLLQTGEERFVLIWSHHHILMDGWCTSIIWNDFKLLYINNINDEKVALTPAKRYSDYLQWMEIRDQQPSVEYWENYLNGYTIPAKIPEKNAYSSQEEMSGLSSEEFTIEAEVFQKLKNISKSNQITLNTIIQTAWGMVLSRYNNTNDVIFGSVLSGRSSEVDGIEHMVGLFINTVPVRLKYESEEPLLEILKRAQEDALKINEHQYFSLSDIQGLSELGNRLFDHIMIFENYPISDKLVIPEDKETVGFTVEDIQVYEKTNYDLVILVIPGDNIRIQADYNPSKYSRKMIVQIMDHLKNTINSILEDCIVPAKELNFISKTESIKLLNQFNKKEVTYPSDKTIIDLFEEQALCTPDVVAVQCEDQQITYYQLHKRSSEIALVLRERGIGRDSIVGLLMHKNIDTVIGMLAILKAGGAYLPIDINYPEARKDYIIENSGLKIILTTSELQPMKKDNIQSILIEDIPSSESLPEISYINAPTDLCYVIYTSGTTGNPKGVMIEHKNVVRLLFNADFQYSFSANDVWTMFHSHCFDVSVWEMYGALLYGAKLIIIPPMLAKDTKAFLNLLNKEKVTVLSQTPSAFYNLILADSGSRYGESMRYVILAGESVSPIKLKEWTSKYPDAKIINMYGITETTVHNTYKELGAFEVENNIANIGTPIPTLSMILLDENKKLVPNGVEGEIYVGGEGVARGYLNNEELTSQRFIAHPYSPSERLYRSGDLAIVNEIGELEYKTRMDHQVQLRGFRVELEEIQYQLLQFEGIKEVNVLAKEINGETCLIAYYISSEAIETALLRKYLLNRLPDYMVPSYFIAMQSFPLTSNGKLDKKALPEPQLESVEISARPTNQIQKELIAIWAEMLMISEDKIGINTNFFEIGGNSLKLMKMVDKINQHFNTDITVAKVFAYPVISSLSVFLSDDNNKESEEADMQLDTDLEQMNDTMNLLNLI